MAKPIILHVSKYIVNDAEMFDVAYESGRIRTYFRVELPTTVKSYMKDAVVNSPFGNTIWYEQRNMVIEHQGSLYNGGKRFTHSEALTECRKNHIPYWCITPASEQ